MSHRQRPSPAQPRTALAESKPYNIIPIGIGAVRNQREHLVLHLANAQMHRSPPPDNIDVLDVAASARSSYLGKKSNIWISDRREMGMTERDRWRGTEGRRGRGGREKILIKNFDLGEQLIGNSAYSLFNVR